MEKRNKDRGLASKLAMGLAGLMAILPASQVSCTNTRTPITEGYNCESRAYNALKSIASENPQKFEKFLYRNEVMYHDSSLKLSHDLFIPGLPESGKGRYIRINADGNINIGYIDVNNIRSNESVYLFYNKAKGELVVGCNVNKFVRYSDINGICRKGVYSGDIEGMKTDGIPFKDIGKADKNEVKRWLNLVKTIATRLPFK